MANSCASISAYTYDRCESNLGGIKKVWLANYVEDAATVSADTISSFNSAVTWQAFGIRKNTASFVSNLQVGDEGGNYVQTDLSLVFSKMDTDKRLAMVALAKSEAMAIVEDANGKRWFLGKDNPITASAGAGETGTAKSDPNHYTLTLTDESLEFPMQVSNDITLPNVSE